MSSEVSVSNQPDMSFIQARRATFTEANHGKNWIMPFFDGQPSDFMSALHARATKLADAATADFLFNATSGVCAVNPATRMVFSPATLADKYVKLLHQMGELTVILVCVRAGFLKKVLFNAPNPFEVQRRRVGGLFNHMRKEHNARIVVLDHAEPEWQCMRDDDKSGIWGFIRSANLDVADTDPGRGLSTAIKNAKHLVGQDRTIFSRTVFLDDRSGDQKPEIYEEENPYECGIKVAKAAHAAPLISNSLQRCMKCFEPWNVPINVPRD